MSVKHDIADIRQAPKGKLRMEWASNHMPVLARIGERFSKEKPLAGLRLSACLHVTSESVNTELRKVAEEWIGPIAARAPVVIVKLLIGLIVMTVSLFYFLADGRRMFEAVTRLVPLDRRYQWQLLDEFEEVSRAVVSSTLLAAIVQAVLAGFGFYVAGLGGVFLLTLLTFFGALVPFVGAA